jgi:FkbM family methyltransferase
LELAQQLKYGLRRPDQLWRKVTGRDIMNVQLEEIARLIPDAEVVLEAGGYDGTDTVRLASQWPQATVHSFEPVPQCFEALRTATHQFSNVRIYPLALADNIGEREMHVSESPKAILPLSSSLFEPKGHLVEFPHVKFNAKIIVRTSTIDQWAEENGVDRIDFAWLDMQGAEISALGASPRMLPTLRAIYMEVARDEFYSGAPVYDEIVAWMNQAGFRIGIDRVCRKWGNVLFVKDNRNRT